MIKLIKYIAPIIILIGGIIIFGILISGCDIIKCYPQFDIDGSYIGFKCGGEF